MKKYAGAYDSDFEAQLSLDESETEDDTDSDDDEDEDKEGNLLFCLLKVVLGIRKNVGWNHQIEINYVPLPQIEIFTINLKNVMSYPPQIDSLKVICIPQPDPNKKKIKKNSTSMINVCFWFTSANLLLLIIVIWPNLSMHLIRELLLKLKNDVLWDCKCGDKL